MSLEAALKENTETMRELIEVLTRTTLPEAQAAAGKAPYDPQDDSEIPEHLRKKVEAADKKKETKKKPAQAEPAQAEPAAVIDDIPYETVKLAIQAAAKKDKPNTIKTLQSYKAQTGQDLKPADYAQFLKDLAEAVPSEEELA